MVKRMESLVTGNGRIAELRRSMKFYPCAQCQKAIKPGDYYYAVTIAGGGLGSIKFPWRVHEDCISQFLKITLKGGK